MRILLELMVMLENYAGELKPLRARLYLCPLIYDLYSLGMHEQVKEFNLKVPFWTSHLIQCTSRTPTSTEQRKQSYLLLLPWTVSS